MRKKLVTAILVSAVAASSIIGLTACGASINGGVKVSEEEWKAAFKASVESENYTVDVYNYYEYETSYMDDEARITEERKTELSAKTAYNIKAKKAYSERNASDNVKTVTDGVKSTLKATEKMQSYAEYGEEVNWLATYAYSEQSGTDGKKMSETYWSAEEKISVANYLYADLSALGTIYTTEKNSLLVQPLSALYKSFTYDGGVYTATLWELATVETKVSVSIKDGYVVGYQTEVTVDKKDGDDYVKSTRRITYNFSNYGKTNVKAPGDAVKAIEKAKK